MKNPWKREAVMHEHFKVRQYFRRSVIRDPHLLDSKCDQEVDKSAAVGGDLCSLKSINLKRANTQR